MARYVEYALWLLIGGFLLYRCVLPIPAGPPPAELAAVRVATSGKPVMVVFDGSR